MDNLIIIYCDKTTLRILRRKLLNTLYVYAYSKGPVFLDHRDELEGTYKVYCQNHDEAISLLEIYEKDEKIQKHLQDSLADLK